ncbi:MAG TPA: sialidase family protein, partial [Pirellulales bacterium]|nr:sialidase family protein [Pirellulales bacterium]
MLGIKPTASLSLVLAVSLVVCCCSAIAEAAPVFDTTIVYAAGEDGYLTYRLPAIVSSTSGELFAFADAKKTSVLDNAATDLVLKTSSDNGQTWTNLQVVVPGGANYDGSASPLIDSSGNIIVTYLQTQGSTQQLFVTRSSDLGHTWSSPVDITTQVSDPTWNWHVLGPAHAIQLTSGR